MRINYNEFLALVYADLFDFPLSVSECKEWSVVEKGRSQVILKIGGYYFLKGREKLVRLRKEREEISKKKLIKLTRLIELIRKIPTVEGIFVTGSVAMGNATAEADLDLMIVTAENCLWLTRILVVEILKVIGVYRGNWGEQNDRVCTNIYLDIEHLEIKEKNLYTAHEVLQAKCVFDRGGVYYRWRQNNKWTKEYLPNAYKVAGKGTEKTSLRIWGLLAPLELLAYFLQFAYMRKKITNERIGWGHAFFHPKDLSSEIIMRYQQRIRKYLA